MQTKDAIVVMHTTSRGYVGFDDSRLYVTVSNMYPEKMRDVLLESQDS